ncbi:MAG: hypothetical protein COS76_01445 [Candidatus Portnoybacteria bacterium CG06_land_8_20_14_3_00_39_12]|uniref:Transcriptional repressor PaaX-like central Cas2-like domain-containing protein n=1 Tax=Candidatus Portnoybacteria bacterium CG06_land_8_20_14_3_00_39_12 TaxID=1974809 RepID=A0A2M7AXG4_9BACT|nr:MAG: hypothetical protein COS76_01445 [Candidatus Portnoybacteria bacterium CG06_land_8_20_14_3_00_39_12]
MPILFFVGAFYIAAGSPYFILRLMREFQRKRYCRKSENKERFANTFYYLKRQGYIKIEKKNRQIYISLTEEGKKKAKKYQIDDLEIKTPPQWDKKWRLIIFDIPNNQGIKREAFRGKLKELGFFPLQKSVWAYPYECDKEIKMLRDFFGLNPKQLRIITTDNLEEDRFLRQKFRVT